MTYHVLTIGKSKAQRAEFDLLLAGDEDEKAIAEANTAAMEALGQIGAVPPRKKARSK